MIFRIQFLNAAATIIADWPAERPMRMAPLKLQMA
jgi:hypothetical protein